LDFLQQRLALGGAFQHALPEPGDIGIGIGVIALQRGGVFLLRAIECGRYVFLFRKRADVRAFRVDVVLHLHLDFVDDLVVLARRRAWLAVLAHLQVGIEQAFDELRLVVADAVAAGIHHLLHVHGLRALRVLHGNPFRFLYQRLVAFTLRLGRVQGNRRHAPDEFHRRDVGAHGKTAGGKRQGKDKTFHAGYLRKGDAESIRRGPPARDGILAHHFRSRETLRLPWGWKRPGLLDALDTGVTVAGAVQAVGAECALPDGYLVALAHLQSAFKDLFLPDLAVVEHEGACAAAPGPDFVDGRPYLAGSFRAQPEGLLRRRRCGLRRGPGGLFRCRGQAVGEAVITGKPLDVVLHAPAFKQGLVAGDGR